jgi:hypothetical protein
MSFALPAPNQPIPLSDRWWLLPRFRGTQEVDRDPKPTEPSTAKIMRERLSHTEAVAYREQLAA